MTIIIVIFGAYGFFGSYLIKNVISMTDENIIAVSRRIPSEKSKRIDWLSLDILDRDGIDRLLEHIYNLSEPVTVYFLAAYHNPDKVKTEFRLAWDINVTALSYIVNKISRVRTFYYTSTDNVYGQSYNSYHFCENDRTCPINAYGRQKVVAEQIVLGYGFNVARFPFLIGRSLLQHKKHFYDNIVEALSIGEPIRMFADSYRSSLSFDDAARLLVELSLKSKVPNLINVCGDEDLSKYEIALRIAKNNSFLSELVIPISMDNYNDIFVEERAKSTLMSNDLLKNTLSITCIPFHI